MPLTDPALRFKVAAVTSSVPEESWIEPVLLTVSVPPIEGGGAGRARAGHEGAGVVEDRVGAL